MSNSRNINNIDTSFIPPRILDTEREVKNERKNTWHWIQVTLACIIKIILSVIAASLVWNCNSKENILFRIILTILAVMFSEIYILYYAVYRVYMGNKCPV